MDASVTVVASRNWADVRAALGIAHDSFVEAGYQRELPSGVRLLPEHLNPATVFALGLLDGRPAASVAVIADGPFGLPSDRSFVEEIDRLRDGRLLYEVGSLGIQRWAANDGRALLAHLYATIIRILSWPGPDTYYVASFDRRGVRFHNSVFGMEPETADERPLYGAAAELLGGVIKDVVPKLGTGGQFANQVKRLVEEESPTWLKVNIDAPEWPAREVGDLLHEAGVLERLEGQRRLLEPILEARRARTRARATDDSGVATSALRDGEPTET